MKQTIALLGKSEFLTTHDRLGITKMMFGCCLFVYYSLLNMIFGFCAFNCFIQYSMFNHGVTS